MTAWCKKHMAFWRPASITLCLTIAHLAAYRHGYIWQAPPPQPITHPVAPTPPSKPQCPGQQWLTQLPQARWSTHNGHLHGQMVMPYSHWRHILEQRNAQHCTTTFALLRMQPAPLYGENMIHIAFELTSGITT